MKTQLRMILMGSALVLALSIPAKANTIVTLNNGNGCGGSSCFGNVVTLTIAPTGSNHYTVTMAVDTTGNTNAGTSIGGVNFKFGTGITGASLTSFPGAGPWTTAVSTGLNANGCGTGGGASFGCSFDAALVNFSSSTNNPPGAFSPLPKNGTYTWIWNAIATGTVSGNNIHVGVLFGDIHHTGPRTGGTFSFQNTGIISGSVAGPTPIPEPSSLLLLGSGLIGFAGIFRRKLMR